MSNEQEQPSTKSAKQRLAWLALLLSLIAIVLSATVLYQSQRHPVAREVIKQQILAQQADWQQRQQAQWQQIEQKLAQQKAALAKNQLQTEQALHLVGHSKNEWVLTSIQQKLRLASLNLYFNPDVEAITRLLQNIDKQVQQLNDVKFLPLRKALAGDISRLGAAKAKMVDLAGLLSQLTALQDNIDRLPAKKVKMSKGASYPVEAEVTDKDASTWRRAWQGSLRSLQKIVSIRRHEVSVSPLLSNAEQQYLQQNLYLLLQQAKWAALSEKTTLYKNSLQQAITWVQQYFAYAQKDAEHVVSQLEALKKINIKPQLPALTASQHAIEKIIKTRFSQAVKKKDVS